MTINMIERGLQRLLMSWQISISEAQWFTTKLLLIVADVRLIYNKHRDILG